jgi:nitrate/TMAO reductase-like tetraheme cytochrome c subunit
MGALRVILGLALACGLALFVVRVRSLAEEPLAAAPEPLFATNESCRECHREIWDEWQADEHARAWFNEPFLAQDPKLSECNACHASRPILEVGLAQPAEIRSARFEEGIGCIECHAHGDHVEGPNGGTGACAPRANRAFATVEVCAPCHAAHGSIDEWRRTSFAAAGMTCQTCHMPEVLRPSTTGDAPRRVRSHRMRSQSDVTMLQEAVRLEARSGDGWLVAELANVGAAHAVPGEIFNRELFLATRVLAADGSELALHRESLKTVRREQRASEPSTQLAAGEVRRFEYALPAGATAAELLVGYKRFYLMPDEEAVRVHAQRVDL